MKCLIDRCELFNRLAAVQAEDANEMKAKVFAIIQSMPAVEPQTFAADEKQYYKVD